jgi:hypothetical protein
MSGAKEGVYLITVASYNERNCWENQYFEWTYIWWILEISDIMFEWHERTEDDWELLKRGTNTKEIVR